jgi:hypothetical protein
VHVPHFSGSVESTCLFRVRRGLRLEVFCSCAQVEGLARKVLQYPLEIIVGGRSVASESITQFVEVRRDAGGTEGHAWG